MSKEKYKEINTVLEVVASHFGIEKEQIFLRTRKQVVVWKRQVFHFLVLKILNTKVKPLLLVKFMRDEYNATYDRTSILNSRKKVNDFLSYDTKVQREIEEIEEKISYARKEKEPPTQSLLEKLELLHYNAKMPISKLSKTYDISFNQILNFIYGEKVY